MSEKTPLLGNSLKRLWLWSPLTMDESEDEDHFISRIIPNMFFIAFWSIVINLLWILSRYALVQLTSRNLPMPLFEEFTKFWLSSQLLQHSINEGLGSGIETLASHAHGRHASPEARGSLFLRGFLVCLLGEIPTICIGLIWLSTSLFDLTFHVKSSSYIIGIPLPSHQAILWGCFWLFTDLFISSSVRCLIKSIQACRAISVISFVCMLMTLPSLILYIEAYQPYGVIILKPFMPDWSLMDPFLPVLLYTSVLFLVFWILSAMSESVSFISGSGQLLFKKVRDGTNPSSKTFPLRPMFIWHTLFGKWSATLEFLTTSAPSLIALLSESWLLLLIRHAFLEHALWSPTEAKETMNTFDLIFKLRMIVLAISSAWTTVSAVFVGNALGANDPQLARRSAISSLIGGCLCLAPLVGIGSFLFTFCELGGVADWNESAQFSSVTSFILSSLIGVFSMLTTMQLSVMGIYNGCGHQRYMAGIIMLLVWLLGFPFILVIPRPYSPEQCGVFLIQLVTIFIGLLFIELAILFGLMSRWNWYQLGIISSTKGSSQRLTHW